MKTRNMDEVYDLLLVGAGPASLAALHAAKEAGLRAVAVDKGPVCGALLQHPTYMRWFSTSDKLELAGFPLQCNEKNPTRQEYLHYCRAFVRYFDLDIITYQEVVMVVPADAGLAVRTRDLAGRERVYAARNVCVATGFYDSPRALGVPGETLAKVSHRYSEAHYYFDQEVMIVGAGSSAAEVALELYRAGAHVTVAMRGERFVTKYWIEPDIENRIREGSIVCHRGATVREILPDEVVLTDADGKEIRVPNDFVLAMTGYEPDTSLLEHAGVQVERATGKPVLSEHFETNVPGLYVVGTLCAGCESNTVFVENSRDHGPTIVRHIQSRR